MTPARTTRGHHGPATPSPVRGGRGRARRGSFRGLTLLELLLGITILAVLGALVFASVRPLRAETRLRTERDRIDSVVREARELAMRSGEPVAVVFDPATGRLEAAPIEDRAGTPAEEGAADAGVRPSIDLAPGVRLSVQSPADEEPAMAVADRGDGDGDGPDPWSDAPLEPWRLAVFLPDGTVLLSRSAWLRPGGATPDAEAEDRPIAAAWRLGIHPWTGEPVWVDEATTIDAGDGLEPWDEEGDEGGGLDDVDLFDASGGPGPEFGP